MQSLSSKRHTADAVSVFHTGPALARPTDFLQTPPSANKPGQPATEDKLPSNPSNSGQPVSLTELHMHNAMAPSIYVEATWQHLSWLQLQYLSSMHTAQLRQNCTREGVHTKFVQVNPAAVVTFYCWLLWIAY